MHSLFVIPFPGCGSSDGVGAGSFFDLWDMHSLFVIPFPGCSSEEWVQIASLIFGTCTLYLLFHSLGVAPQMEWVQIASLIFAKCCILHTTYTTQVNFATSLASFGILEDFMSTHVYSLKQQFKELQVDVI
jgi:hypothetical protein